MQASASQALEAYMTLPGLGLTSLVVACKMGSIGLVLTSLVVACTMESVALVLLVCMREPAGLEESTKSEAERR